MEATIPSAVRIQTTLNDAQERSDFKRTAMRNVHMSAVHFPLLNLQRKMSFSRKYDSN
jgi:hypothetical protein